VHSYSIYKALQLIVNTNTQLYVKAILHWEKYSHVIIIWILQNHD